MEEEELKVLPSVPALTHPHRCAAQHTRCTCVVLFLFSFRPFSPTFHFTLQVENTQQKRNNNNICFLFPHTHTHRRVCLHTTCTCACCCCISLFSFLVFSLRSVRLNFCLFRWYFENDHNTQLFSCSLCFFFSSPRRLYRCCCFFLRSVMF